MLYKKPVPISEKSVSKSSDQKDWTIKSIGVDLIEIAKIDRLISGYNRETLALVFSAEELNASQFVPDPGKYLALCFASKEAIGKVLSTGLVEIHWFDITTKLDTSGYLSVTLSGSAHQKALELDLHQWEMSWFSWQNYLTLKHLKQCIFSITCLVLLQVKSTAHPYG